MYTDVFKRRTHMDWMNDWYTNTCTQHHTFERWWINKNKRRTYLKRKKKNVCTFTLANLLHHCSQTHSTWSWRWWWCLFYEHVWRVCSLETHIDADNTCWLYSMPIRVCKIHTNFMHTINGSSSFLRCVLCVRFVVFNKANHFISF